MVIRMAWRGIWRNRRRTLITVGSIALGLGIAIFFIAVAEGMYAKMIDQVVRMQAGHITLEPPGYRDAPAVDLWLKSPGSIRSRIRNMPVVDAVKLIVLGQGIAKSSSGNAGAAMMGVEPSVEAVSSPIVRNIVQGEYLEDRDAHMAVIGSALAKRLNLRVGKKLVLTTNDIQGNLVEELCRVKGIFETGSDELDAYFVQIPIGFARRLFKMPEGSATQVGVVLKDPDDEREVASKIRAGLDGTPVAVLGWQEVMPEMASYIKVDKGSNIVLQAILIFLILFTIFNTLLMSVLERQREFAVQLAVGTRPGQLRLQILLESAFIGLIGCCIGLFVGGLASYLVGIWGIDMRSFLEEGMMISGFAMDPVIRTKLTAAILLTTAGIVFGATLFLSLVPMHRAARLSVAELLR